MNLEECSLAYKLVKERYEFELKQKSEFNGMVSVPVTFLSAILVFLVYVLSNFPKYNADYLVGYIVLWIILSLFVVSLLVYILCFYMHQRGLPYAYVASPNKLSEYQKKYENAFKSAKQQVSYDQINSDVSAFMFEQYTQCAETNIESNRKKNFYYRVLMASALVAFSLLTVIFVFELYLNRNNESLTKVEIIPPVKIQVSDSVKIYNDKMLEIKEKVRVKSKSKKKSKTVTKKEVKNDPCQSK